MNGLYQSTGAAGSVRAQFATDMITQEALTSALKAMPYPALLLQDRTRILTGNIPARRLFNRELDNLDLIRILRHPDIVRMVNDTAMIGQPQMVRVTLHLTSERVYEVSLSPVKIGKELFHIMSLLDVSAEIDAEKARSSFVANVSHELRSPLTAITGMIETLQGPAKNDPEAQEHFLNLMSEQSQRMSRLISELLSLSTLESREHIVPRDPINLEKIIHDCEEALAVSNPDFKGRIRMIGLDDLPIVAGDADQLTEVFQNILENALKYSDTSKSVVLSAESRPADRNSPTGRVKITVRDKGDGIDPEHLPRLTERFYRVDNGRSREMGGTGLGLAIVKHIVNRHRGRMRIESQKGEGTTVTVWLNEAESAH